MGEQSPISSTNNNIAAGAAYGSPLVSPYELPLTWHQMNQFLFKIQSGSLSSDAVMGVAVAYSQGSYEEETRKLREYERAAYATIEQVNKNQRELFELAEEILRYIEALGKIDPENKRRVPALQALIERQETTNTSINALDRGIQDYSKKRDQGEEALREMIQNGKTSGNPAEARAAQIVDRRREAGGQVVTVTYRMGDEVGVRPQHLVYEDQFQRRYIKDSQGNALFIDELPVSEEERRKMHAEIDRQRGDRRYTRDGNIEKFGNESPEAEAEFNGANAAFKHEIESGNSYMLMYDELLSQNREFRNRLQQMQKEYQELVIQRDQIAEQIETLKSQIGSTPEARRLLNEALDKMDTLNTKSGRIKTQLERDQESIQRRFDVLRYMSGNAHSEETLLQNLPDQQLSQAMLDRQAALRERLRKIQEMEEQLQIRKENADTAAEAVTHAEATAHEMREHYVTNSDPTIKRSEWMAMEEGSVWTEFVRDEKGSVVSYDARYGLFYSTVRDETTNTETRHIYRDPTQIVGFFKDAWERGLRLGNESELRNLTMKDHLDDLELSIGFSKQASIAMQQSLTMQQNLLATERAQIEESLRTGEPVSSGAGAPSVDEDPNRSVASQVAPDSTAYTPEFNAVAPNPSFGGGIFSPNNGAINFEKKKPVISITSDAGRS
jgi:uncharacterized coiled-coil DUF342 family protein